MLASDSRKHKMTHNYEDNINSITIDVVCQIEKELLESPYDMTSLVFLLYDVPDTALQRLLVYQRVSKDIYSTNLNLLHEWIQVVKSKSTWRHEFLEALLICQLYGIVRKLGFNIQSLKKQYQPDNINFNMYINPTKKALYKLCENIDADNLNTLKKSLLTFKIDTTEYESSEMVFLKLMSEKIIILTEIQFGEKSVGPEFNFDKFLKLVQKLPGLESFVNELKFIQNRFSSKDIPEQPVHERSEYSMPLSDICTAEPLSSEKQKCDNKDFSELYNMLNGINLDEHLKSDSKIRRKDTYPLRDPQKIGLCIIVNQEEFHLCDQSIEDLNLKTSLSKRKGSNFDKIALKETMSSYNFEVVTKDNLNQIEMMDFIKKSITQKVDRSTSVFMLCILSHGVRGHIFAADSTKVKVEDIQNILDDASNLRNIPKVMIIQACQVDDIPQRMLVADSPALNIFSPRKLDFLVYWATSPEYEAYRVEEAGSIFIQFLCVAIQKQGKQEHLDDIFTNVNRAVYKYCIDNKHIQVPVKQSSLRRKLYLEML